MKIVKPAAVVLCGFLATAPLALADDTLEMTQQGAFLAFDANQDGTATAKEMVTGLFALFASADTDSSGDVSVDEFKAVSLGYAAVAETSGKQASYDASRDAIYKRWDSNADGKLTEPEMVGGSMLEILDSAKFGLSKEDFFKTAFIVEMTDSLK
jgi:Ca2+-binding EF-hand superfamily protein